MGLKPLHAVWSVWNDYFVVLHAQFMHESVASVSLRFRSFHYGPVLVLFFCMRHRRVCKPTVRRSANRHVFPNTNDA